MMVPQKAISRCQEIVPELEIEIYKSNPEIFVFSAVEMDEWKKVFERVIKLWFDLKLRVEKFPDVNPFLGLADTIDDLGSLIHALYIFYEFTMQE